MTGKRLRLTLFLTEKCLCSHTIHGTEVLKTSSHNQCQGSAQDTLFMTQKCLRDSHNLWCGLAMRHGWDFYCNTHTICALEVFPSPSSKPLVLADLTICTRMGVSSPSSASSPCGWWPKGISTLRNLSVVFTSYITLCEEPPCKTPPTIFPCE